MLGDGAFINRLFFDWALIRFNAVILRNKKKKMALSVSQNNLIQIFLL